MGQTLPNSGDWTITPSGVLATVNRDLNGTFRIHFGLARQSVHTIAHGKIEGQRKVDTVSGIT